IKFVLLPDGVTATDADTFSLVRGASARVSASVGKRPRLDDLWDVTHVSPARAREPRRCALQRCPRAERGDRCRRPEDHAAARAVAQAAWRGRRAGEANAGSGRVLRGAAIGQSD